MLLNPIQPLKESVNYIQDSRTGTIVVPQFIYDLVCRAELIAKTAEQLRTSMPKAVNGLIDVSDSEKVVRASDPFHQLPLQRIRVLKFVHQYEVKIRCN